MIDNIFIPYRLETETQQDYRLRQKTKQIKECQFCGYSKRVEVCHIKPISSFDKDTPIDTINDMSNLLILCPNCHWELDNKYRDIDGQELN